MSSACLKDHADYPCRGSRRRCGFIQLEDIAPLEEDLAFDGSGRRLSSRRRQPTEARDGSCSGAGPRPTQSKRLPFANVDETVQGLDRVEWSRVRS
jgi:hypothetical protein